MYGFCFVGNQISCVYHDPVIFKLLEVSKWSDILQWRFPTRKFAKKLISLGSSWGLLQYPHDFNGCQGPFMISQCIRENLPFFSILFPSHTLAERDAHYDLKTISLETFQRRRQVNSKCTQWIYQMALFNANRAPVRPLLCQKKKVIFGVNKQNIGELPRQKWTSQS